MSTKLEFAPLTPARWPDLEAIFAARGCSIARQCWCMAYRVSRALRKPPSGMKISDMNRSKLKALVDAKRPPGLIAYRDKVPVGWVALGPREDFAVLQNSPVMKPVDDQPVWSVVCFVVPSEYRKQGVAGELLAGAVKYARKRGVRLLEAYPVDKEAASAAQASWFGSKRMFDQAGFEEVVRRRPDRPVVRLKLVAEKSR